MPLVADQRWTQDPLPQLLVNGPSYVQAVSVVTGTPITNVETVVAKIPLIIPSAVPPGTQPTLRLGSRLKFILNGTSTSTVANATTLTLRLGTAGTTADTSFGTFVSSAAGTTGVGVPFHIELNLTFTAVGATVNGFGTCTIINNAATALAGALVNVISNVGLVGGNTNTATFLDITCVSAAATTSLTFNDFHIEVF